MKQRGEGNLYKQLEKFNFYPKAFVEEILVISANALSIVLVLVLGKIVIQKRFKKNKYCKENEDLHNLKNCQNKKPTNAIKNEKFVNKELVYKI